MKKTTEKLLLEKKYHQLREMLCSENSTDIARLLSLFPEKDAIIMFRLLPKSIAAETFAYMERDLRMSLIRTFTDAELREVISELYIDDTVDIIEELPANVVSRVLKNTDSETRREINKILRYPEDSAGSIMTTEYVTLSKNITCDDALKTLRRVGIDKETIYTCYVTEKRKLIGVVTVKDMLISADYAKIGDIMERNVISVTTDEDRENVARIFDEYDFLALPVVDKENCIVGIVTVDDAIDVIRRETNEDIEVMAAITPASKPYLKTGTIELMLRRIPWLFLLMLSAALTGGIISSFEESLGVMPILTAYIPMLMGTGGNAGGQASATIIRGLALDEIKTSDVFIILWKEARVAILCGVALSIANFAKIMLFDRLLLQNTAVNVSVALAVSLTLVITVIAAKLVGCVLPLGVKKIGLDPAVMASPFITSIIDAFALAAYFRVCVILIAELQ